MADFTDKRVLNEDENKRLDGLVKLISPLSDDYSPSISDKTRAGYFTQDYASQTERSDIVNLKDMTSMVEILVKDLSVLKKSLYYARHVLEADYKSKLEEKGLYLYCRVNDRIVDLEKMHEERVKTIRRSFKQQLSDAVVQVANDNERRTIDAIDKRAKLAEKHAQDQLLQKEKGKAKKQQEALVMMMKMQMKEQQERAERELEEAMMRFTPSPIESTGEVDELRMMVENLEAKLDDLYVDMDEQKNENKKLLREVDDLSEQLQQEREVVRKKGRDLKKAEDVLERVQIDARIQLERQKADLQREYEAKIGNIKSEIAAASRSEFDEFKSKQMLELKQRDLAHQRLLNQASKKEEKQEIPDTDKDHLIKKLRDMKAKLTVEIGNSRKELDRVNKTWEMKVTVLKQSMHALKDEAFLRATLQKQAAKLHHASVAYAKDGPALVPSNPMPVNKRYRILPAHVRGDERFGVIPGILARKDHFVGNDDKPSHGRRRTNSHPLEKSELLDYSTKTADNAGLLSDAPQRKDTNRTIEINIKT